jgi:hypothetical protein
MNLPPDNRHWQATRQVRHGDDLLAPQTQVVKDRDAYLGEGLRDVGQRIADDQLELFITGEVAASLQQQFLRLAPDFIALHDVGVSASLRQLNSLAQAAGARVQRLSLRRQGHGVALAVLQFVELPLADGSVVRLYSTDVDADTQARAKTAMVLLAYSRLGVLMVGELPPHALSTQLKPVRDAMAQPSWANQDLLLVPLGSGTAFATQAAQLKEGAAVRVNVTPRASTPAQVWDFIGGAWNRLTSPLDATAVPAAPRERPAAPATSAAAPAARPAPVAAPQPAARPDTPASERARLRAEQRGELRPETAPAGLSESRPPLPPTFAPSQPQAFSPSLPPPFAGPLATPMPVPGGTQWQPYAESCAAIKGAISACVFDMHSSEPLAHAGSAPAADRLAQQGSVLLVAMNNATRALGLGSQQAEATVSTPAHHLLLRPVPGHPGVAVHLVVQARLTTVSLAHMQLERIEPPH